MQSATKKAKQGAHSAKHLPKGSPDAGDALLPHILKGLLITAGVGGLLIVTASLIACFDADPQRLTAPLGLAASALTALAGGWITVRIHKRSALLCGLCNAALLSALMLLLSLLMIDRASGYPGWLSCLLHLGFALLSVLGAFLGLPSKKASRATKRRN